MSANESALEWLQRQCPAHDKPGRDCKDRRQCWEPCGEPGKSEEHARIEPKRRIVCAAIRAADGDLLLGIRHYSPDMHRQIEARVDGAKFHHRLDEDQGFVDQFGKFMTREEAWSIAAAAGQIPYPDACGFGLNGPKLYSEGLY